MTVFAYKKQYKRLRETNPKWFSGKVQPEQVDAIAALVKTHNPSNLLDYGSGAGYQYLADRIHERWGGLLPVCYDIGVPHFDTPPLGTFDGVICIDVMEHIHTKDINFILNNIVSYVNDGGFIYFLICCHPAHKHFEDGQNVHLTIQPPDWWRVRLDSVRKRQAGRIVIEDEYEWVPGTNILKTESTEV